MSNPRTPISELLLTGSPNLRRALDREKAEADAPALTLEAKSEVEKLDALIAQALKCCKRGATFRKKTNPAFAQLSSLMKCRDLLLRGKKDPSKKSAQEVLQEADKMLAMPVEVN
jgi:hypothetical protein